MLRGLVQYLYNWVKRNVLEDSFIKFYDDKEDMMTVMMQMTVNKSRKFFCHQQILIINWVGRQL